MSYSILLAVITYHGNKELNYNINPELDEENVKQRQLQVMEAVIGEARCGV